MRFEDEKVVALSKHGFLARDFLHLNDAQRLGFRADHLDKITRYLRERSLLLNDIREIKKRLERAAEADREDLNWELEEARKDLDRIDNVLARLAGQLAV